MRKYIFSLPLSLTLLIAPAQAINAELSAFLAAFLANIAVKCGESCHEQIQEKRLIERSVMAFSNKCSSIACCGMGGFPEFEHAIPGHLDSDKRDFVVNMGRTLRKRTDPKKFVMTEKPRGAAEQQDAPSESASTSGQRYNLFKFATDYTTFLIRFYDEEQDCQNISQKLVATDTRKAKNSPVADILEYIKSYFPSQKAGDSDYFIKSLKKDLGRWLSSGKLEYVELFDSRFFIFDKAMIFEITPTSGKLQGIDVERDSIPTHKNGLSLEESEFLDRLRALPPEEQILVFRGQRSIKTMPPTHGYMAATEPSNPRRNLSKNLLPDLPPFPAMPKKPPIQEDTTSSSTFHSTRSSASSRSSDDSDSTSSS